MGVQRNLITIIASIIMTFISQFSMITFTKEKTNNTGNTNIKVMTTVQGGILKDDGHITSNATNYYSITKSGIKKCDEFEGNVNYIYPVPLSSEEKYQIYKNPGVNVDYSDEELEIIYKKIIELVSKEDLYNSALETIFVSKKRCFVSVLENVEYSRSFYEVLYEYDAEKNTIKEITRFEMEGIQDIYVKD